VGGAGRRDPWARLSERDPADGPDGTGLPGARKFWLQLRNTSLEMDAQTDTPDEFYRKVPP
jgi:hypothetical protein